MKDYGRLQRVIGYQFTDSSLLTLALTHRSFSANNNERLEFLGDALLSATIAESLYFQFPQEKEGILSRLRANLVKGETLAEIAREFDLGDYLILGEGELKSGGFRRESILADAVEAIIGAIFLDANMDVCQQFIRHIFDARLKNISVDEFIKDPKTRLQELLQGRRLPLPVYDIVNVKGESHQQEFIIRCETVLLDKAPTASAPNRRQAEKLAAQKALELIESLPAKGI